MKADFLSQCTHSFNISLNQCVKDNTNPGMAYLITVNPCLDALTNPADIPTDSISIVWNGASSTCDDSLGADIITYGVPSLAKSQCILGLYDTYMYVVPAPGGSYNALLFCDPTCSTCQVEVTLEDLNTCISNGQYPGSGFLTLTSNVTTCYTGQAEGSPAGMTVYSYVIIFSVCVCVSVMAVAVMRMIRRKPEEREYLIAY